MLLFKIIKIGIVAVCTGKIKIKWTYSLKILSVSVMIRAVEKISTNGIIMSR